MKITRVLCAMKYLSPERGIYFIRRWKICRICIKTLLKNNIFDVSFFENLSNYRKFFHRIFNNQKNEFNIKYFLPLYIFEIFYLNEIRVISTKIKY